MSYKELLYQKRYNSSFSLYLNIYMRFDSFTLTNYEVPNRMYFTAKEIIENYVGASEAKAKTTPMAIFGKAIMAGLMIAMGAACSNVAAHAIDNVGIARLIAGCVFPVGLMMVVVLGAELFTGDCLMITGFMSKKITGRQLAGTLALVYLGNFVGGLLLSTSIYLCGQMDYSGGRLGAYTIKVALGKVMLTPVQGIVSGILCNILVCAAVLMAMAAKDISGKLLASFFVIMLFVTGGFEHCVANMYYITAGMLAQMNDKYVAAASQIYGIDNISALNLKNMIVSNLIPVTIGNILGGFFLGWILHRLNIKREGR